LVQQLFAVEKVTAAHGVASFMITSTIVSMVLWALPVERL